MNNWIRVVHEPPTPLWGWRFFLKPVEPEKAVVMDVELYVGNLSRATTQEALNVLFTQAGDVTAIDLIMDHEKGGSKGFAFITMSAQSEADKAVSMFNFYSLDEHRLKVKLTRPREQRGFGTIN